MTKNLQRASTLLDQETKAILSGNIAQLERLHRRKEPLLSQLETDTHPYEADQVRLMQGKANRNARLLKAMIEGIEDAHALLVRVNELRSDETYSRDGARTCMTPPQRKLQHKA